MGPRDEAEITKFMEVFEEKAVKKRLNIAKFKGGKPGKDLLRRYVWDPEINVSLGVFPGVPGEESYSKGIIDGSLRAELVVGRTRLDFRIVPELRSRICLFTC